MQKLLLVFFISILITLGYFAWKSNQISEVNNIMKDSSNNLDVKINENKNKSEAKEEKEKVVINTITGENVPEGFYDEVLADGYTYNNPKPIPESWIMKPAGDGYPATIDYYKFFDEASESQTLPGKIGSKTEIPDYMYGYSQRAITISFKNGNGNLHNKSEFTNWFNDNFDLNFSFLTVNKSYNYGGWLWGIYITEGDLQDIKNIQSKISNSYDVRVTNFSLYLLKYRGTKELEKFREVNKNSGLF